MEGWFMSPQFLQGRQLDRKFHGKGLRRVRGGGRSMWRWGPRVSCSESVESLSSLNHDIKRGLDREWTAEPKGEKSARP